MSALLVQWRASLRLRRQRRHLGEAVDLGAGVASVAGRSQRRIRGAGQRAAEGVVGGPLRVDAFFGSACSPSQYDVRLIAKGDAAAPDSDESGISRITMPRRSSLKKSRPNSRTV